LVVHVILVLNNVVESPLGLWVEVLEIRIGLIHLVDLARVSLLALVVTYFESRLIYLAAIGV